ncbi:DUF1735 and LamG domain-containing protein [Hallella multisaccharivorax]|uniref:BT-3987-like N-terminal domain-containing protein n=1 Tax=Hallella multisaccharivorax DSM 17128 TaxID=688246 RepID=F8N816_9BACT|nr:DUF1735 and LamG domain-containing protein [Hallella multisaccharivorax]EGN57562.1 domain of unknown function DUF1735 [Hallella multisaccharivorax DSM 17128]
MKRYRLMLLSLGVASLLLYGCEDADYSVLSDQAFFAQTQTNGNSSEKITIGNEPVTTALNVRLSNPTSEPCSFEVVVDTAVLGNFNRHNTTSYVPLPEGQYSMATKNIMVDAGTSLSAPLNITFNPLTAGMKNSGAKYALPLKLVSTDGKKDVLNSGSSMVILLDQVIYTPVPILNSSNNFKFKWAANGDNIELNTWTVEMNVNISLLGTQVGQFNNQSIFGGWGSNGKNGEIYIRFGDAPIKGNILQIKTQGTQMNSRMEFKANTWYHIAFVCTGTTLNLYVNGQLDNSMTLPGKTVWLGAENCQMGNQDYLKANVMVSEFRLWTVARSQGEVANNMYVINPESKGLFAYFKFNEGRGNEFADATGHGNSCIAKGTTQWIPNVRIDGK